MSKHFINDPTRLVNTALESVVLTNPGVALDALHKIVYRRRSPRQQSQQQRVSVVSGGGSGHEPSFASFVGPGLLSATVTGTIFASPSIEQIRTAIMGRVDHNLNSAPGGGVLVIIMNYTGDVLNFGVAVEKARAAGVTAEMVVVADDVGVGRARSGKVGRRGIAGTVLVHKLAGALAARGYGLADVARVARLAAQNLVSVGASLERVHVPGRAASAADANTGAELLLGPDEVELGMGIHNEPGSGRERLAGNLPALVRKMLRQLLDAGDEDRAYVRVNSNEVVLMVNNLGGVSPLELGGIVTEVVVQLRQDWDVVPVRVLAGTYVTSLNGPGFSLTLLNVVNTDIGGPSMIDLLDDPAEATGWAAPVSKLTWEEWAGKDGSSGARGDDNGGVGGGDSEAKPGGLRLEDVQRAQAALTAGLRNVLAVEPEVTRYDTVVGDGDCGICMKRGAEAILGLLAARPLTGDAAVDVAAIASVVETDMDGTSGALYTIFLNALVAALRKQAQAAGGAGVATTEVWAQALQRSREALSRYTPARPGDRTLVDALYPFVEQLGATGDPGAAAKAAKAAADGTQGMKASLGRAVYVGGSGFEQVPDPGAFGLASFFLGLAGVEAKARVHEHEQVPVRGGAELEANTKAVADRTEAETDAKKDADVKTAPDVGTAAGLKSANTTDDGWEEV